MQVLRFTGKDNRSALDQVRSHLGPEALILSNRRTPNGVEICATSSLPDLTNVADAPPTRQAAQAPAPQNELQLAQLKRELASLRETLHSALGERKWQDSAGKAPIVSTIEHRLSTLGIGRLLASDLVADLPPNLTLEQGWTATINTLMGRLACLSEVELAGLRIKAVIGTSGAGKTRVAAALVNNAVYRHGADQVAVIVLGDAVRVSALQAVCTAHHVKAMQAKDHDSLAEALKQCRWAREVIIDTPGLNPTKGSQDPVLSALCRQRPGMAALLVLPATGHPDHLKESIEHSAVLPLAGGIISKVDEAAALGGLLDAFATDELAVAGALRYDDQVIAETSAEALLAQTKRLARENMQKRAAALKVAV